MGNPPSLQAIMIGVLFVIVIYKITYWREDRAKRKARRNS